MKPGDILVGKITPKGETELSPEEKLLTAIFGEKAKDVKDSSLKVPPGMEGVVIDVKIFSRVDDQVVEKDRGERIGEIRRLEGEEKIRVNEVRDAELIELLEGQTVALALKSGTVEEAIPVGHQAHARRCSRDSSSRRSTSRRSASRTRRSNEKIRTIIDAANEEKAKLEEKAEERIDRVLQPDELPPGVIQLVKVYMAEKRKISVGDKMAGRHGNKGIVARIVPEEDMPFLPDGRPVDIVLNPLGVPSRMNVGQILETHLGWAARLLGFYAKTPVFQGANEREIGLLLKLAAVTWVRDALDLHGRRRDDQRCRDSRNRRRHQAGSVARRACRAAGRRDDQRPRRARRQSPETRDVLQPHPRFHHGRGEGARRARARGARQSARVPRGAGRTRSRCRAASRRVQDGANRSRSGAMRSRSRARQHELPALAASLGKKSDVDVDAAAAELMRLAGISPGGKVRLRDGRTGETFSNPVTVGEIYMLKLSHLVDDKIHARSIGPYSLVTQQPLAGKAQFGGQRFGEMEVWALEAYGAAHTLQEILTVKSDDVNGRSRVYEAIVKGQNLPEPGIPESFNVLVQELKALGIHVSMGANATSGYGLGNNRLAATVTGARNN